MLHNFIEKYKEQISTLQQEKTYIKEKSQTEIAQLKLELAECKKKVNQLT